MKRIVPLQRRTGILLCVVLMALWFVTAAILPMSAVSVGETAEGSLHLWCVKDEDVVVGMQWQIYRVGHRDADDYVFEGDFADFRPTLGDQTLPMLEWDSETVADAGETLKILAAVYQITPTQTGKTGSDGSLTFSGLEDGLYLVCGDLLTIRDKTYIPSAIFFEMNGQDSAELNAYPKIVLRTLNADKAFFSVRKVWENDEDQPWNRSASITVELYRDNALYDTVTLSEDNGWLYEWEDTADHIWFVHEKVIPENYTVVYKENHTQYLIVNTYDVPKKDSSMTDVVSTTGTEVTDDQSRETQVTSETQQTGTTSVTERSTSDTAQSTTATQTVTTPTSPGGPNDKLPQTGQLWWPVLPLTCGGILLFGLGTRLRRRYLADDAQDEEET